MTVHRTGSSLLDELVARRDTYRERTWPRPAPCWHFVKKPEPESEPEPEPQPEPDPEIFPSLPIDDLPGPVAIRLIQKATAQHFDITVEEMLAGRRTEKIARARMIAVYLSRKMTVRSTPDIGRRFGIDHSSVIYAIHRATSILDGKSAYGKRSYRVKPGDVGVGEDIDVIKWLMS